jgi:outer membrane protein
MNKRQWFLIGAALILVIALYSLPKIILDNDQDEIVGIQKDLKDSTAGSATENAAHSLIQDTSVMSRVEKFKEEYELASNNKKKSIFADSLAKAFMGLRDFSNAITYGKMALDLNSTSENKENLADIYYEAMTFSLDMQSAEELGTDSRKLYEGLLEEQPKRLDIMNKVAMTYIVTETPMKGIMTLREILEIDPNNVDAIFNLGILSIQSGQYDKGIERFDKLSQIDSSNIRALYYLGMCLKETGKLDEAKETLQRALKLNPEPEVTASINALLKEL